MHLRKLILAGGFACSLLPNLALALGLGEAQLNSSLNEPLKAEIKLLDTRGLSADQVVIALASPADFERNGVDRIYFYSEFEFEVLLDNPGGAIVRVSSRGPVREPFLNFLVEARWPTGRLLREYTLLMDLPVFSDSAASRSVVAATTQSSITPGTNRLPSSQPVPRSVPVISSAPSASTPVASAPVPRASTPRRQSGNEYRVDRNDTLWQIALDVRPDSGHSVYQTMLALQRLNPDAFINGNINRLRSGQVLRIPSSEEIRSVSRSDAVSEVARHNQALSDTSMGAQLSASRSEVSARRDSGEVSGSLRLATPSNADGSVGQGSGDNSGRGRALQSELSASLEELDKARNENEELSSRVRDLEEQIKTMERLVEVSSEQLRTLQVGAVGAESADTTDSGSAVSAFLDDSAESPVAVAAEQSASSVAQSSSSVSSAANVVTTTPPPAEKSLLDLVFEYIHWIGAGLLALILALVLLLKRRREQTVDIEEHDDDKVFVLPPEADSAAHEENLADHELNAFDEASDADNASVEAETGDVVGEADIYIAYGKFDQAEEMLVKALNKEPESTDIRLKLLEVYSQTEDSEKFDQHYASLIALASPMVVARATELREQIPGVGDFDLSDESDDSDELDLDLSFDNRLNESELKDFALDDDAFAEPKKTQSDESSLELDDDFSFDLDDELSSLDAEDSLLDEGDLENAENRYDLSFDKGASAAVPASDESEEDDLDFNFDLDDDSEPDAKLIESTTPSLELDPAPLSLDPLDDELASDEVSLTSGSSSLELDDLDFDSFDEELSEEKSDVTEDDLADFDLSLLDDEDDQGGAESLPPVALADDELDDFSPDAAFNPAAVDLDALDREFDALDKEADNLAAPVVQNIAEPVSSVADDENDEFLLDIGDLKTEDVALFEGDEDLADLDDLNSLDNLVFTDNAEVDAASPLEDDEALFAFEDLSLEDKPAVTEETLDELSLALDDDAKSDDLTLADDDEFSLTLDDDSRSDVGGSVAVPVDAGSLDLSDDDLDAELDFLADADEAATKLDLARAYMDMGDTDGARDILSEVATEGNEQQREEALDLLGKIGG